MAGPSNHSKGKAKAKPNKQAAKFEDRKAIDALAAAVKAYNGDPATFEDLPLSAQTLRGLKAAYFTRLTPIQTKALPLALKGKDVLGAARTGSGKTLAFLVPVLENLLRMKWGALDGLGALIISPTRELAVQIFEVLRKIGKEHAFSAGLIIGGKDLKDEQERVSRMNILVATPGRLLQHMDQTTGFECPNLQMLVLDEADRILDMGFSAALTAILENLPKTRQTLLFSATQTKSVTSLARLQLNEPEYVAVKDPSIAVTAPAAVDATASKGKGKEAAAEDEDKLEIPQGLSQHYMVVPLDKKTDALWSFIKTHLYTKTIVFLSSGKQVRFVYENYRHLRPGVPLLHLHGKQKQTARLDIYSRFTTMKHAILFATDVASRGLDFPSVEWVVQVDCPEDVDTYVHRVGRTARYQSSGRSLLFLLPSEEEGMVAKLKKKGIEPKEIKMSAKVREVSVQNQLQSAAFQYPEIKFLAQRAFISYVRSVYLQRDKTVFRVTELPLDLYAASLGLAGAPKVRFASDAKDAAAQGAQGAFGKQRNAAFGEEKEARKVALREGIAASDDEAEEDSEDSEASGSGESDSGSDEEDEEGSQDGSDEEDEDEGEEEQEETEVPAEEVAKDAKNGGVKTKYDRMFNRKSQTILSDHYSKLVDREPDAKDADEDDFIKIVRRDHTLDEENLPSSSYLSKRKIKQGQSKKAIAETRPNATKLVFDDDGQAREIYELLNEKDFAAAGDAKSQREAFVRAEGEVLKAADVTDKERAKAKRREKKRKRLENDGGEGGSDDDAGIELAGMDEDDGYVSPNFDDIEFSQDEEELVKPEKGRMKKKRRKSSTKDAEVNNDDLEAMALRALGRK